MRCGMSSRTARRRRSTRPLPKLLNRRAGPCAAELWQEAGAGRRAFAKKPPSTDGSSGLRARGRAGGSARGPRRGSLCVGRGALTPSPLAAACLPRRASCCPRAPAASPAPPARSFPGHLHQPHLARSEAPLLRGSALFERDAARRFAGICSTRTHLGTKRLDQPADSGCPERASTRAVHGKIALQAGRTPCSRVRGIGGR